MNELFTAHRSDNSRLSVLLVAHLSWRANGVAIQLLDLLLDALGQLGAIVLVHGNARDHRATAVERAMHGCACIEVRGVKIGVNKLFTASCDDACSMQRTVYCVYGLVSCVW